MELKKDYSKSKEELKQEISNTFEILNKELMNLNSYDKTSFQKNMKTLEFKMVNNLFFLRHERKDYKLSRKQHNGKIVLKDKDAPVIPKGTLAYYLPSENKIYCAANYINTEILLHEMIHMTSCKAPGKIGFAKQVKHSNYLTRHMINEGMTQWLTQKALNGHDENNNIYSWQTRIARLLCIASGEDFLFTYFSKADFRKISKIIKTSKEEYPLRKIALIMEAIHEITIYIGELNQIDVPQKELYKEAMAIYQSLYYLMNKMQRIIIDIFIQNKENINNQEKVLELYDNLITNNVTNDNIYEMFAPILQNNFDSTTYFVKQIKKNNKEMYNQNFIKKQNR
jgi:hypothetical protein